MLIVFCVPAGIRKEMPLRTSPGGRVHDLENAFVKGTCITSDITLITLLRSARPSRAFMFISADAEPRNEHGNETKIAEETLQAVKAMGFASDFYRSRWSDLGDASQKSRGLGLDPNVGPKIYMYIYIEI